MFVCLFACSLSTASQPLQYILIQNFWTLSHSFDYSLDYSPNYPLIEFFSLNSASSRSASIRTQRVANLRLHTKRYRPTPVYARQHTFSRTPHWLTANRLLTKRWSRLWIPERCLLTDAEVDEELWLQQILRVFSDESALLSNQFSRAPIGDQINCWCAVVLIKTPSQLAQCLTGVPAI